MMKKIRWTEAFVSRHAILLLKICCCVILVELILMTADLFLGEYPSRLYALRLYRGMLEYIMLDLTVAVVGAFLFDLAARERGEE